MSLSQKIAAEVADLVQSSAPSRTITAEDGPHRIVVPLGLATPVGIDCQGFDFAVTDRATLPLDDLKAWGQRLSARITYLMEPLAVLEADPVHGEVVLRSQAPSLKNGRRSYYEVRLGQSGALRFDRVVFDDTTRLRRKVSCQFTNEVLERLVDDLVATAA